MNIAVTGALGSGKSSVSKIFAFLLGAEYLNTDQLCREQMEPGAQGFRQFIDLFGNEFLSSEGCLDRTRLRQAVFADSKVKTGLEKILHPLVRQEVATQCLAAGEASGNIVVEVPLLYEVGWQVEFDVTIVVYVSESICFERVAIRDGLSVSEIQQVLDAQLPLEEKRERAHFIIDNSGTFVSTNQQIVWVLKKLKGQ